MTIPSEVQDIIAQLTKANFEAYIVGGCVRDLVMGKIPKDWDITTSAKPEEVQKLFADSFYENNFGTVGVKTEIGIVEVTTYRAESGYSDKRRPDEVKFVLTLDEDLRRRDFTINAIALGIDATRYTLHDPFDGQNHIELRFLK